MCPRTRRIRLDHFIAYEKFVYDPNGPASLIFEFRLTKKASGFWHFPDFGCSDFGISLYSTVNIRKPNVQISDEAEIRTIDRSVYRRSDFERSVRLNVRISDRPLS